MIKCQFSTFVLGRMKLSIEHRKKKSKGIEKKIKDKTPRDLGPADTTVHTRSEGPTVQWCVDSFVACKRINDEFSLGPKYQREIGQVQRTLHSWWKKKVAKQNSNIDGCVKHVYREHNQEAGHWANIGAQGQKKFVFDRRDNSETWKAVRG